MATDAVFYESDDEDVEYKGHFCSGRSIPPPGAVCGWVRGYGVLGCRTLDLGVSAAKTTIESERV